MKEMLSDNNFINNDLQPKSSLVGYIEVDKNFSMDSILNDGDWECIKVTPNEEDLFDS